MLETSRRIDTILFDKTGTLTRGKMTLVDAVAVGGQDDEDVLASAAAVEALSEHPIARAITSAANDRELEVLEATDFRAVAGHGAIATVGGHSVTVGRRALIAEQRLMGCTDLDKAAARLEAEGRTVVFVGWERRVRGVLAVRAPSSPMPRRRSAR